MRNGGRPRGRGDCPGRENEAGPFLAPRELLPSESAPDARPSHFGEIPWRQSRARHPAGRDPPPCAPAGTPLRGADGSRRKRPALTVRRAWPLPLGLGPELSTQATQLVGGTRGWPRRRLGPRVLETPRQPTVSAGASSRPQHHTRQQSQTTSPARPASPHDCAAAGARRWHQARRRAGN